MNQNHSTNAPFDDDQSAPRIFRIVGMDCADEIVTLKRELKSLVGGEQNLFFDLLHGRMTVAGHAPTADIVSAVARTGMKAERWQDEEQAIQATRWQQYGRSMLTALSGVCLAAAVISHAIAAGSLVAALGFSGSESEAPLVSKTLYALSVVSGVWFFLPKAWYSILRLRLDMNLLMTIAVIGALGIGEWSEAATVAFLFAVSLALESWSVGRARTAIASLMSLTPPTARILSGGSEEMRAVSSVASGEIFVVQPGERVPLDGVVVRGSSALDQSPITGESIPVAKAVSDLVYAGTINGEGLLHVEATKGSEDTALAGIIRMVGQSQARRGPSEQWVESFARYYTPLVIALAAAVFLVSTYFLQHAFHDALYNALVLLVIACPCALVISTPVSVVAGIAAAARRGVLIKGGVYLELPARLKAFAFDKTGTLTRGRPAVSRIIPFAGHTPQDVLRRAAAMESQTTHPLAHAIVRHASEEGLELASIQDFRSIPGKGATAVFADGEYWLGSHRYLQERGQETDAIRQMLEELAAEGQSVVAIGTADHVCGLIALSDEVRTDARETLDRLRQLGLHHLIMLTGDNEPTAKAIAGQLGITEFKAGLLPAEKVATVEQLLDSYGATAMVGDGVNDAPALARATLGIAMGAIGADAAIETADIALMGDDLAQIAWLVGHSRRSVAIIRQNIWASVAVKIVFVILSASGHASLWAAILADMGVSLLVIMNGLRLLSPSKPAAGTFVGAEPGKACGRCGCS